MGHIETEDEVEGKDVVVLAKENAEPLEHFFPVFWGSIAQPVSVKDAYGSIDCAVDQEGLPDALVEASPPQPEDPVEPNEASVWNVFQVGDSHLGVNVLSRLRQDPQLDGHRLPR